LPNQAVSNTKPAVFVPPPFVGTLKKTGVLGKIFANFSFVLLQHQKFFSGRVKFLLTLFSTKTFQKATANKTILLTYSIKSFWGVCFIYSKGVLGLKHAKSPHRAFLKPIILHPRKAYL
jgi:hypothetical protein